MNNNVSSNLQQTKITAESELIILQKNVKSMEDHQRWKFTTPPVLDLGNILTSSVCLMKVFNTCRSLLVRLSTKENI